MSYRNLSGLWRDFRNGIRNTTAALLCLALAGCGGPPAETKRTDNASYDVGRLFTVDGCSVYRFHDDGIGYAYFTNCAGGTSYRALSGKTTRPVNVPTSIEEEDPHP